MQWDLHGVVVLRHEGMEIVDYIHVSSLSLFLLVAPVIQPELLEFPGFAPIELSEGGDLKLICTVQAGLNAHVWWTTPDGVAVQSETEGDSSLPPVGPLVYSISTTNTTSKYVIQYSSVLYLHNFSSELAGVYVCIADDPGYPGETAHEEYQVEIKLLQEGLQRSLM